MLSQLPSASILLSGEKARETTGEARLQEDFGMTGLSLPQRPDALTAGCYITTFAAYAPLANSVHASPSDRPARSDPLPISVLEIHPSKSHTAHKRRPDSGVHYLAPNNHALLPLSPGHGSILTGGKPRGQGGCGN